MLGIKEQVVVIREPVSQEFSVHRRHYNIIFPGDDQRWRLYGRQLRLQSRTVLNISAHKLRGFLQTVAGWQALRKSSMIEAGVNSAACSR